MAFTKTFAAVGGALIGFWHLRVAVRMKKIRIMPQSFRHQVGAEQQVAEVAQKVAKEKYYGLTWELVTLMIMFSCLMKR